MSVLDTLKAATPSRRIVTLCLDGALQAEWEALRDSLDDVAKADEDSGSLALPNLTKAVTSLEALREQVAASEVRFTFEQMPWPARVALQADHPPRADNLPDQIRGYNIATYAPAVIKASCVAVTDVNGDEATDIPADVWASLLGDDATKGSLNYKQVDQLVAAANAVNDGDTTVPPSARSLLESQDSGASLAQPDPGTSPPSGSEAGSRRGSRKSTATKKAASNA